MLEALAEYWLVLICITLILALAIMSLSGRELRFTIVTSLKKLGIRISATMSSGKA